MIIGLRTPPSDSRFKRRPLRLAGGYDEQELTGSQIRERSAQVSEYRSYPSIVHGMSRFLLMSHGLQFLLYFVWEFPLFVAWLCFCDSVISFGLDLVSSATLFRVFSHFGHNFTKIQ